MQTAPFYPLYLVLLLFRPNHFGLLSVPLFNGLFIAAHIMAALFMFTFLRHLRVSRFSAFVAGFAFSSGSFTGAVTWPHMLQSAIWLPCIALFLFRALEARQMRPLVRNALFSGFFLGLSLLAGGLHVAIAQTIFIVTATIYYARAQNIVQVQAKPAVLRCASAAAIAVIAGMGVAAVQLFPSHLYAQHSLRAMGGISFLSNVKVPYTFLTHDSLSPRAIASFLFPSFDGIGSGEIWTPYVGVLPFLFAALAVTRLWSKLWVRYLVALGIGAFLYSLAGSSALHGVLYVIMPFLWMAREATRFVYLTGFCVCVLAAFGIDYFLTSLGEERLWNALKRSLSAVIAACLMIFLIVVFVPKITGYWEYFSLLLILASCILLRYALSKPSFRYGPLFRVLLIGLLFFDLNAYNWTGTNKLEGARAGTDDLDVLNSLKGVSDYLRQQPKPFRVSVQYDPEPNIGDAYGIPILSGGGVTLDRYAWKVLPFTDLLNVMYLIRPASAGQPGPIYEDKYWKVYRNANAFPRAWIVHQFQVDSDEGAMYLDTKTRRAELRKIAFLATAPDVQPAGVSPNNADSVEVKSFSAEEIRLTASVSSPGLLVLGEMYYPEWHAFVNGREVKILRTDEALRSIVIPAGQSEIEFTYRPMSAFIGAFVSTFTCCFIALAALWRA
jgi:hypothetical protein